MFAPLRFLVNRRTGYLGCWPSRILALVCLTLFVLAVAPPAAKRMSASGVRGSTTKNRVSLPSELLLSRERSESAGGTEQARLRIPESAEAWKYLPALEKGTTGHLPVWARALAKTLPRTTAALLELDYRHREQGSLDPILRAQVRWMAAHANGCRYSEVYAAADLRRAGASETDMARLAGDLATVPAKTRAALQLAHRLSCDGSSVTDAEVAQLISLLGERQTVALVMLVGYASFQDRMILALGLPLEVNGPLPPLDVQFARLPLGASRAALARQGPRSAATTTLTSSSPQPKRHAEGAAGIQELLTRQRARRCRISLAGASPETPRWGLVCRTYQPELTDAWAACTHAFSDEANQDPLFEQYVFWLITHDIHCFY